MKSLLQQLIITTFMLFYSAVTDFAQGTATVFGRVNDANGAVIPGAKVTVTNVNTNAQRETVADEQGNFLITSLPVGVYRVEAEQSGFKRYVEQNVQLQVDERRQLNIILQTGAISESVSVTSDPVQVETRTGTLDERRSTRDSVRVEVCVLS